MTLFNLFRAAAITDSPLRKKLVIHLNRKLRPNRKLPFVIYFNEESTRDRIVLRIEHREHGTTHRCVVTRNATPRYWHTESVQWSLDFDMGGSDWHHKKSYMVEWLRNVLSQEAAELSPV